MKVSVLQDKFSTAWDGKGDLGDYQVHSVVDLRDALTTSYASDAHVTMGVIHNPDTGASADRQPRLSKSLADQMKRFPSQWEDTEIRFGALLVDVDCDKDTLAQGEEVVAAWSQSRLLRLEGTLLGDTAGYYLTKGGFRLIWTLPTPLNLASYEDVLLRTYTALYKVGVTPDWLTDWTRLYRLPKVPRYEGIKNQINLSRLGDLPIGDLPAEAMDNPTLVGGSPVSKTEKGMPKTSKGLLAILAKARSQEASDERAEGRGTALKTGEVLEEGSRNQRLFRIAANLPNQKWIPKEAWGEIVSTLNEHLCDPPLEEREIRTITRSLLRYEPGEDLPPIERSIDVRVSKGTLPEQTDLSRQALTSCSGLYQRDGRLVQVAASRIDEVKEAALKDRLSRIVRYYTVRKKGDDFVESPADCPQGVIKALLEIPDYPGVPELEGISSTTMMRKDGTLVDAKGYDPDLATYFTDIQTLNVPANPTFAQCKEALGLLEELLADFPFADSIALSVVLAAMLTPVARSTYDGPTPLILFGAATPGEGKSLLADVVSRLATGDPAARMAWAREEEVEKRITSVLMLGKRLVLIDNVDGTLGGPSLDAVLTSTTWTGRVLGKSEMVTVPAKAMWMATGNNVRITGDLQRRVLYCFLESRMERPEERTGFKHKNLLGHISDNRIKYLSAAMTVIRGWLAVRAETPLDLPATGSFEGWSNVVRGALVWMGHEDPVKSRSRLTGNGNARDTWGFVLRGIKDHYRDRPVLSKDLFEDVFNERASGDIISSLRANLEELMPSGRYTLPSVSKLLARRRGVVVDGLMLGTGDRTRYGTPWVVETHEKKVTVVG